MNKMVSIAEASSILGVSTKTLRRWDSQGKLKAYRTLGNHRRYKLEEIEALLNKPHNESKEVL